MGHLDLTQELLDTEREVVLEERRMRTEDSPQGLAFEALLALAFRAHPSGQDENYIADSYAILDLSVKFNGHNDRWSSTLFVKNALDEFYVRDIGEMLPSVVPNGYTHRNVKLSERQYGLEVRYRWH